MKDNKNINLNPGGGIAHQEIHIHGTVEQVYTAATSVTNTYNYYDKGAKPQGEKAAIDRATAKKEILKDVELLVDLVRKPRRPVFMDLWNDILELKEVKYDFNIPGKNEDKQYNRKLVAGIIHFIGSDENNCLGWFDKYNASEITRILLKSSKKSIRGELGAQPSAEVREAIKKLIKEKYE